MTPTAPAVGVVRERIRRTRSALRRSGRHALWIAIWSVVGWVGTALAPALASQPLVLMLLSPRALFVAMASNSVSLVPFVLLGTARLAVTDFSYFVIGQRLPPAIDRTKRSPRRWWTRLTRSFTQRLDRLCRWCCARPYLAAAFLFFRPNGKYLAIAGAYGVRPWSAALSSATGTASFLAAVHIGVTSLT